MEHENILNVILKSYFLNFHHFKKPSSEKSRNTW